MADAIDDVAAPFYGHHGFGPLATLRDGLRPTKALEPYLRWHPPA